MHVRSNVLKTRNLPQNTKRLDVINSKPYLFILLFCVIGIFFLMYNCFLIGIAIMLIFGYQLLFVRNVVMTEFYEEYVVFYMDKKREECFLLFWNDVRSWAYIKKKYELDMIEVVLKNDQSVTFKCLSKRKLLKNFMIHVGDLQIEKEE